jgi:hypothetical protein
VHVLLGDGERCSRGGRRIGALVEDTEGMEPEDEERLRRPSARRGGGELPAAPATPRARRRAG